MIQNFRTRFILVALHIPFYTGFAIARNAIVPMPFFPPLILGSLLIWISVVDIERMEIPNEASILLAFCGAMLTYLAGYNLAEHLIAGLFWAGLFWVVGVSYAKLRGWDGLGFGDVKLMAGLGIWLGIADTTMVVFAAALTGILVILASKLAHRHSFVDIGTTAVAFGPFLCLSAWVFWLY